MKIRDLLDQAKIEIAEEIRGQVIHRLKERLYEIGEAKKALAVMEKQLEAELGNDLDAV